MEWVYPRTEGWFEEMYENPVMFSLWKNDVRVSKEKLFLNLQQVFTSTPLLDQFSTQ